MMIEVIALQRKGTKKNAFTFHLILNLLFIVCLIGIFLGAALYRTAEVEGITSNAQTSTLIVLRRCIVCYGSILLLAKTSLGVILTPLAVCLRGIALGITAFAQSLDGEFDLPVLLFGVIELSALYYLASASVLCSYGKIRRMPIDRECIKAVRGSVFYAAAATAFGAILFLII